MKQAFNGERLRLARLLRGATMQELGESASLTRQSIHQYESGSRFPNDDVVEALAEYLCVESSFFFDGSFSEVRADQCHFRKRRTTPVGVANRVLAFSTLLERLVDELHEHLDLPENDFGFVDLERVDALTPPIIERIAEVARERWGLTKDAPIDSMVDVAENAGAVVTYFDGVSDKVDALSVNRRHPLIIRNNAKKSVCRMRFDLAHECGHLIMHDGIETGCKQTEREADAFASAFLFPRRAFAREFPKCVSPTGLIWHEVYQLKKRWKMSVKAIVFRANFLGLITAQQYRAANVWLSQTRQTRSERGDDEIPNEDPHILKTAIGLMDSELGITFEMMARKLGIKPEILAEITGLGYEERSSDPFDNVVVPFKF